MVLAAQAAGVRVDGFLEKAGLDLDTLLDPEARIPGGTALAIWNDLREASGDPLLQLRAPVILPFGAYRVIDYLADASATVGEAFERVARFFRLIAARVALPVEVGKDGARITLVMEDGGAAPPVYAEYTFAAVIGRIRANTKKALRVERVEFAHVPLGEVSRYEAFFGCPVHFESSPNRFSICREEWEAPTDHGDEALAALLEEHAEILARRLPEASDDIVAEVRQVILEALPESPGTEEVAGELHMSTRTLQRKLARAGESFSGVSEAVRAELAKEYLTDRAVGISEVAFLLGFSEQSSFHRAFRRWTGLAPGKWRERVS
jgi:AraC-like DNA-binding protein